MEIKYKLGQAVLFRCDDEGRDRPARITGFSTTPNSVYYLLDSGLWVPQALIICAYDSEVDSGSEVGDVHAEGEAD